jgi:hypothetical protein
MLAASNAHYAAEGPEGVIHELCTTFSLVVTLVRLQAPNRCYALTLPWCIQANNSIFWPKCMDILPN